MPDLQYKFQNPSKSDEKLIISDTVLKFPKNYYKQNAKDELFFYVSYSQMLKYVIYNNLAVRYPIPNGLS